jgi:acyl-coenzyme A synthetase/AMP-(fatty) acid ligase
LQVHGELQATSQMLESAVYNEPLDISTVVHFTLNEHWPMAVKKLYQEHATWQAEFWQVFSIEWCMDDSLEQQHHGTLSAPSESLRTLLQ